MAFQYPYGLSGILVGDRDLAEFSAKLQTAYTLGASQVDSDTFQGKNRSSLVLLDQSFGAMEIVLPLEVWGSSRTDTAKKWSALCGAFAGEVDVNLGDGFLYHCVAKDFGHPAWLRDDWLTSDVTLLGIRQKATVTFSTKTDIGSSISCMSTFPRTDCTITLPASLLDGATLATVTLGDNTWSLPCTFTGSQDLVLDGVNKIYLLGGENVTAQMEWEDFPYLVPGDNPIAVYINSYGVTRGIELKYRPTFL